MVATAPTVHGIETRIVRKGPIAIKALQQHLPFTVLKLVRNKAIRYLIILIVATAPTVHGIETEAEDEKELKEAMQNRCNSTYRSRY